MFGHTACAEGEDDEGTFSGDDEIGDEIGSSGESGSEAEAGSDAGSEEASPTEEDSTGNGSTDGSETNSADSGVTGDESGQMDGETGGSDTGDPQVDLPSEENCEGVLTQAEEVSYIWIANSGESTVSKIETQTGVEVARYFVRPDEAGNPSRTSVNTNGDVVVASRAGGLTKILANIEDCQESNGIPGIQTSSGSSPLPFDIEECIAWHTPIPHDNNRPVAWTRGAFNEESCEYEGQNVWTAWADGHTQGSAVVGFVDGHNGDILVEVPVPGLPVSHTPWSSLYGAAVDLDDNVYFSQLHGGAPSQAWLVRVNISDFSVDSWVVPGEGGYGMTVTPEGYVFLCGRATTRFYPPTETWKVEPLLDGSIHTGGCMGDGNGLLYRASYSQIQALDINSMEVVNTLDVGQPGDENIWGVAVDFEGYVWGIPRYGSRAYRVDPDTSLIDVTADGLVSAYTYSDMTGFQLASMSTR